MVLQIFCPQGPVWVKCPSLKRGIIQANNHQIFLKVNHVPKLYARYHDLSSSGSPDILFKSLLNYTKCQSQKRDIIQPNICQKLITLDTVSMANIMTLAQAVLQIFCSQGSLLAELYPSSAFGILYSKATM